MGFILVLISLWLFLGAGSWLFLFGFAVGTRWISKCFEENSPKDFEYALQKGLFFTVILWPWAWYNNRNKLMEALTELPQKRQNTMPEATADNLPIWNKTME